MTLTHVYEDLTWPEVNEAVAAGCIPVLPVGATEQHGPHLPLKIDRWTSTSVVDEAAKRSNGRLLAMPPVAYGYTTHVMDFPGTITIHHETFIRYIVDIGLSLAYHGFKKILIINGHGSNMNPLELAARRIMLESDAWVGMAGWWTLTETDPDFRATWRDSVYPGGSAHAGEAETAMALHFDPASVRTELAVDQVVDTNAHNSRYHWVDMFASGPVKMDGYTSTYSEDGTQGEPSLATAEKGRMLFEESVTHLVEFGEEFAARKFKPRVDHHDQPPTSKRPG
jgi:creatinine amidohydrolase